MKGSIYFMQLEKAQHPNLL